jgi:IclR family pca regulon transcriptional regulator
MDTSNTGRKAASPPGVAASYQALQADQDAAVRADVYSQLAEVTARHSDDRDFVTALARGIAVMQALAEKRRRMSMAQISHITGIPRGPYGAASIPCR